MPASPAMFHSMRHVRRKRVGLVPLVTTSNAVKCCDRHIKPSSESSAAAFSCSATRNYSDAWRVRATVDDIARFDDLPWILVFHDRHHRLAVRCQG